MAPFPRWADLPPELVCRIGDHLDLIKWYVGARGACTAWRRALVPPSPALLVVGAAADQDAHWWRRPLYAASLTTRRSLELTAIVSGTRSIVGASNGWLALSVVHSKQGRHSVFVLLNPVAGLEIRLPPLIYEDRRWVSRVSKVVFTPCPTKDDFAAAAICDDDRIAYVTAGARRWAVMGPVPLTTRNHLTDLVYNDNVNAVYCLTMCGDVHVLRLPDRRRRRRKPAAANVDEAEAGPSVPPEFSVLPPPQPAEAEDTILLQWQHRRKRSLRARTRDQQDPTISFFFDDEEETSVPSESLQGPDLNFPATVEPLLSEANLPFNPATAFAPPYDIVTSFTSAKNLVFCKGNLYQVWRNESCTVILQLPGGGQRRLVEHEVLVLRYYPERQPCWDVVKDLGGHSFFVGRNNAVSMYAEGVPGLRSNCVYWIGGRGRDQGMVFDMKSGRSTPCRVPLPPPVGVLPWRHPHRTICWYFLCDSCNEHQQQLQ